MNFQNPKRKQIRIPEYDYSQEGYYFITICTKNRKQILSKIVNNENINNVGASALGDPQPKHITNLMQTNVGADDPVRPETENKIELTEIGKNVEIILNNINCIYNNVILDKYVIMPNHIHLIIIILEGRTESSAPTKNNTRNKISNNKRMF